MDAAERQERLVELRREIADGKAELEARRAARELAEIFEPPEPPPVIHRRVREDALVTKPKPQFATRGYVRRRIDSLLDLIVEVIGRERQDLQKALDRRDLFVTELAQRVAALEASREEPDESGPIIQLSALRRVGR